MSAASFDGGLFGVGEGGRGVPGTRNPADSLLLELVGCVCL